MDTSKIKKEIGTFAASLVTNRTIVGLGTGSTAHCFIESLAKRYREEKLQIRTCATSYTSEKLAKKLGLPVEPIESITHIDVTFDGADEVDPKKNMIKGAGGALLREKIIASASNELIILVDETKLVKRLGRRLLPVEVVPFGHHLTAQAMKALGYACRLRKNTDGTMYVTDNHNYIYDIALNNACDSPKKLDGLLKRIPGVVETGFFFSCATRLIVGYR